MALLGEDPEMLVLTDRIRMIAAKAQAYREKGLDYFDELSKGHQLRIAAQYGPGPQEATKDAAPVEKENVNKELRQQLLDRLTVCDQRLPVLLKELAIWREKIQQALDVLRAGQHMPLLDHDETAL